MPPLSASPSMRTARRPAKRRVGALARWAWRGLKLGLVLAACVGLGMAWRSGKLEATAARAAFEGVKLAAECGFRVEEVEVVGRVHTNPSDLLAAAGVTRGDPILGFSPESMRRRIEALPWVETAAVERRLPNTVAITIVERTPIALWQHNERISLIDARGGNLGTVSIESAPDLPLVVGGDAPAHIGELLAMLAEHPDIQKRVQASSWIGSRRWDLKLDNGVEVRLPENGAGDALRQLADAESATRVLERDVAVVDLRLAGRMIVRLAHEIPAPKAAKPQQGI